MKTIRKILYATDFSGSSIPAAEYALTLAKLAGAHIHVAHVMDELADTRKIMLQPETFAIFEREIKTKTLQEMEEFCKVWFGDQADVTQEILIGTPFQAILECAAQQGCDIIVMGTHGRSGIGDVLMGSTAQRVVRRAIIPVLTVRGEATP